MEEHRALNYFTSPAFLKTDLKAGVLRSRGGARLVGISEDFLRGFVTACEHETGPAATMILHRCGRLFGGRLAKRVEQELGAYLGHSLRDSTMGEFSVLIGDLWHGFGMGDVSIDWSLADKGILPVKLAHSPMQDIGPKGHVADDMFCGIIEGFLNHFAGDSLSCIQTGDVRLGDKTGTTFILADADQLSRVQALVSAKVAHGPLVAQLRGG